MHGEYASLTNPPVPEGGTASPPIEAYVELFFDEVVNGRRYARRDLTASMTRASSGQI
jgi:hypothetical protein